MFFSSFHINSKKTIENYKLVQNTNSFLEANREINLNYSPKTLKNIFFNDQLSIDDQNVYYKRHSTKFLSKKIELSCNCNDIMIVDDEEFIVKVSKNNLKKLGLEADVAYNGKECLSLIEKKKNSNCDCPKSEYKLILIDVIMPEMGGIQTVEKIQEMIDKKELNSDLKVVFVSGNVDDELKNTLTKIDCVKDCYQKPLKPDKYQKIIQKYYSG